MPDELLNPLIKIAGIELEIFQVTNSHVYLENQEFPSIAAGGNNMQEAIEDFLALLPDLITEYALCPDDKLADDAKRLKYYLLKIWTNTNA